jgi:PAS domain S-box-containing protein
VTERATTSETPNTTNEERYRAFIEHSSEGIWRLEFDPPIDTSLPVEEQVSLAYAHGRFAEVNQMMARMYGLDSPDDLTGRTLEFMLPSTDAASRAYLADVVRAGYRVTELESTERDAHGGVKHFANSMSGIVIDGRLHRIWGTQRDISDRKQGERAQAFLAAIVDSADDAIIAKGLDGIVQSCNAAAERMFGYAAAELVGQSIRVLIPPDRQHEEDDILVRLRRGERIDHFETVRMRKDGTPLDISLTVSPVRDSHGVLIGASKIARDITEQKRAAAERAAQQAWFRITLGSIGDGVIASDPLGRVTFVNAVAEQLTGWSEQESVGRPLHDVFTIVNEKTRQPVENPTSLVLKLGHVVGLANHTVLIARDGSERPIADSAAPIRDRAGRMLGVVLVFRDVTDERRSEDALAEQREWLQTTLDSIGDAVIATDLHGRVVLMNPVAEHLSGWALADVRGRASHEVFRVVDEHSRQVIADPVTRALVEGTTGRTSQRGLLIAADGSERPIDESAALIRGADARIGGVVLVFRDASERRRAERERQSIAAERERLLEAERAARGEAERASRIKDEFVAMVSHELRTPLNAILGWTQLMTRGKSDAATIARGLDVIVRNTRLQAQLISDLLDVSRIVAGKLQIEVQSVDLRTIAADAIETIRPEAEAKNIRFRQEFDTDPAIVAGDPARLQQVIWNLLSNAVKFTPAGGDVSIDLHRHGSAAEIVVSDTGAGIRPDMLPFIFDRFHQADRSITRRFGGLGLGLSIVKHLVELHGGSVAGESAGEGKGARFTIALPVTTVSTAAANPADGIAESQPPVALDGMRVLVVEDEPDTREFLRRLLESHGAMVTLAASAAEALAALHGERPDILVSDIGLPDVDGYELMQRIRQGLPEDGRTIPAIALTAYARQEDRTRALRAGYQTHLAKPVEAAELLMTIASFANLVDGHRRLS